jgi:peptidoglycan hydrolase-like protein with peptidoglycan-binding domain
MGYIHEPFNHGCVIESVTAATITSIDGNSPGDRVARRYRAAREFTTFYSIASLLSDEAPALLLQRALRDAGYDPGAIDGRMGPRTRGALDAWALDHPERVL